MMLATEALATSGPQLGALRAVENSGLTDFLKLADASPAKIWTADNYGLCTFVNRSWLEFRGRAFDQELGSGWTEGIHPDDSTPCMRTYWAAFNGRRPFRIEYRILGADRVFHEVERLGSPWFDSRGEQRGYVGCISILKSNDEAARSARRQLSLLSGRERQVLELIAMGHSTKQVAGRLSISYKTADSHRTHVLKKLAIHETATLVRFAIRAGVIPV
jgi:PAS domain S-box-containing protein